MMIGSITLLLHFERRPFDSTGDPTVEQGTHRFGRLAIICSVNVAVVPPPKWILKRFLTRRCLKTRRILLQRFLADRDFLLDLVVAAQLPAQHVGQQRVPPGKNLPWPTLRRAGWLWQRLAHALFLQREPHRPRGCTVPTILHQPRMNFDARSLPAPIT
jgi:hypothetical protein